MPFPHHNGTNGNSEIWGRKSVSVMSSLTPEFQLILHQTQQFLALIRQWLNSATPHILNHDVIG